MLTSWLFTPGDDLAKMTKARGAGADAVILDLEDSVASINKSEARLQTAAFLNAHAAQRTPELWVRINPLSSAFVNDDLAAIVAAQPDGIILPKSNSGDDIRELDRRLSALEAQHGLARGRSKIVPIATETPLAVFTLHTFAGTSQRLAGLTWGAEDLPAAVGASIGRWENGQLTDLCRLVRSLCIAGAAVADVPAIETVYPDFRDLDGLRAYAERGRKEGFLGMMAIHPAQVKVINEVFTPSEADITRAKQVVALFEAHPDQGTIGMDGRMLDAPHLKQAQRILKLAERRHSH